MMVTIKSCLRFCHEYIFKLSITTHTSHLSRRNFSSRNDSPTNALKILLGCSYHRAYTFVRKYPELKKLDSERISRAGEQLKRLGIDPQDLREYPQVLCILPVLIEQRTLILRESGFPKVTAQNLIFYGTLIKKKISLLKSHGCIPEKFEVSKNYLDCLQAPAETYKSVHKSLEGLEGDKTILHVREIVLGCYLQGLLNASAAEVRHLFATYSRISNKSLLLLYETLKILLEELKFPESHVKTHGYLLCVHPQELWKLLKNVPSIGGMTMRDFLYQHPIVATTNYDTFTKTLKVLKGAGISEETIIEVPLVFTVSVKNIQQGLNLIKSNSTKPEIKALLSHPQMLKLVIHHDSVNQRLNYLGNLEGTSNIKPVTSLNLLCGSSKMFERYISGLGGTSRGNDVVLYITKTLENKRLQDGETNSVTQDLVRDSLKRHVHWRNVPLSEIQSCLDMLLKIGFTCKEIMFSLQIVLYSPTKVLCQLKRISMKDHLYGASSFIFGMKKSTIEEEIEENPNIKGPQSGTISIPSHMKVYALPLCLYYLEKEHHFSGDGIWFRE